MNKEKMMKDANLMYTVVNLIEKVVLVGLVAIVLGGIAVLFVPKGSYMTQSTSLTLGSIMLELSENALPAQSIQIWRIEIGLVVVAMILALIWYGCRILKTILSPMKEGRPFEDNVAMNIRKIALLVFWGGLVGQVGTMITSYLLVNQYVDLMSLFKEGVVKYVTVNYSFELGFILIALMLYLLSNVFEYGQQLQIESDETL